MPSFYRIDGLNRVATNLRGKPILTAQEVEDVVAFLVTLKNSRKDGDDGEGATTGHDTTAVSCRRGARC